MKIVFFTDTYEPQINGVVTSIKSFERELRKLGHKVYIVAPKSPGHKYPRNVHVVNSMEFKNYPEYRAGLPSVKTVRWITKIDPDVIHVHSPAPIGFMGMQIGKLLSKSLVATYHTMIDPYFEIYFIPKRLKKSKKAKKIFKKFVKKYTKYFYNQFDVVIVPSTAVKNLLRKYDVESRIEVIPTGVNIEFFRPLRRKRKFILWVGRLSREKRIDLILKAMKIVQRNVDIKLVIVGDGPDRSRLERLSKKLKINSEFLGYVKLSELPKLYSSAISFVSASQTETQGLTILEAFACGCPVVVSDSSGFKDFVSNGKNGFLIDSNDPEKYAKKILELVENAKLRKKLSSNAIKTAKKFSEEKMTKRLIEVYNHVIKLDKGENKFLSVLRYFGWKI